jgi:beta-glucosidase
MNTGKRKGKEVSQLYIHDAESSVVRPYKELKGFAKTELEPGESKQVSVLLNRRALQFYDVTSKSWVAEPGQFEILIGSSSKDLILKKGFILKK